VLLKGKSFNKGVNMFDFEQVERSTHHWGPTGSSSYFSAESHNNIGTWETAGNQSRELLRLLSTYATTRPLFLARFDRDFSLYPKP